MILNSTNKLCSAWEARPHRIKNLKSKTKPAIIFILEVIWVFIAVKAQRVLSWSLKGKSHGNS